MLVLDEQLLGRDLDSALARWYRGPVLFITDVRPGTVIKDDAIPVLLRQQHQATFLWPSLSINRDNLQCATWSAGIATATGLERQVCVSKYPRIS
jgi:hypothetical protein